MVMVMMMMMMMVMMVMITSDLTQPPGLEPLRADLDELKWEVISISTMMMMMSKSISIITIKIMMTNLLTDANYDEMMPTLRSESH